MCGIIGYFGDRANGLSRVLTAMASILYRAPDSTGVAWFGDKEEPIRVRKTVGALSRFVETQLSGETRREEMEILVSLLKDAELDVDYRQLQKALLRRQGLPEYQREAPEEADYHELIDAGLPPWLAVLPGSCGTPKRQCYPIGTVQDFNSLITDGIQKFDLPPLVVRTLAAAALRRTLRGADPEVISLLMKKRPCICWTICTGSP